MRPAPLVLWLLRVAWASLPFTAGPALAATFRDASGAVQVVATIGLWVAWAVGLGVSLVPATVTLTVFRLLAPGPLAGVVATAIAQPGAASALALGVALVVGLVVVVLAFRGEIGRAFVEGSAYGDEGRFPLRPPGPLVLGPLPVMWLALAATVAAGPLLLAARSWWAGSIVSIVALLLLTVLPRRFHRLSRRFLVFVPAGLALHDHLLLAETAMFRWAAVAAVTQALHDSPALDLTADALGSAVQVTLTAPDTLLLAARGGRGTREATRAETAAFLFSPTLTQAMLAEAARRRRPG